MCNEVAALVVQRNNGLFRGLLWIGVVSHLCDALDPLRCDDLVAVPNNLFGCARLANSIEWRPPQFMQLLTHPQVAHKLLTSLRYLDWRPEDL